jgi:phosphoribosyl 1,2-cyclic phosphodiesterase
VKELVVLGSGGGRYVTMTQQRRTGGLLLVREEGYFVIDPGPGSILSFNELGFSPFAVRAVLVSHRHPDHYGDAEVYVEAMTHGGSVRRGVLAGAKSVVEALEPTGYPALSNYHLRLPARVEGLAPTQSVQIDGLTVTAFRTFHTEPHSIGFHLRDNSRHLTYVSDTELHADLEIDGRACDLLIVSVLRPGADRYRGHLCSDDVVALVERLAPKRVLITHFGAKMLRSPPTKEADQIARRTHTPVVAAEDGLRLPL